MPHESLWIVVDIVEVPPPADQYHIIQARLMASHQMTSYQRAEKLFAIPALSARKPSDLMAAMLEICPRDEEKTELFACLFLQWLPRELRLLLAKANHKDSKALADKADNLRRMHMTPGDQQVAVTVSDALEGELAAVRTATEAGRGQGGRG
jgi:hypothetical protein